MTLDELSAIYNRACAGEDNRIFMMQVTTSTGAPGRAGLAAVLRAVRDEICGIYEDEGQPFNARDIQTILNEILATGQSGKAADVLIAKDDSTTACVSSAAELTADEVMGLRKILADALRAAKPTDCDCCDRVKPGVPYHCQRCDIYWTAAAQPTADHIADLGKMVSEPDRSRDLTGEEALLYNLALRRSVKVAEPRECVLGLARGKDGKRPRGCNKNWVLATHEYGVREGDLCPYCGKPIRFEGSP